MEETYSGGLTHMRVTSIEWNRSPRPISSLWSSTGSHEALLEGIRLTPTPPGMRQQLMTCVEILNPSMWRLTRIAISDNLHGWSTYLPYVNKTIQLSVYKLRSSFLLPYFPLLLHLRCKPSGSLLHPSVVITMTPSGHIMRVNGQGRSSFPPPRPLPLAWWPYEVRKESIRNGLRTATALFYHEYQTNTQIVKCNDNSTNYTWKC